MMKIYEKFVQIGLYMISKHKNGYMSYCVIKRGRAIRKLYSTDQLVMLIKVLGQ